MSAFLWGVSYGFLLEYDWNIYVLEFSDVFQTVQSVSGKSADGLGDNHVDVSGLAVVNHTVKVLTFFCVGAGNTIIGVDNGKFQFANLPFERGEILFSKGFSVYTDIRKLQDKAKTSLTISHTANLTVEKVTIS